MCDYEGHDFGATYPDACCIDGYLWDLDSCDEPGGSLYSGGDLPCPQCNHEAWLENLEDEITCEGWEAAEKMQPREAPYQAEKLKYPSDLETLRTWWLSGYDQGIAASTEEKP